MTTIYEPCGEARINNFAHRFGGEHASRAIRQAARAQGLATLGSYDIVCHAVADEGSTDAELDRIVIRAFSPGGRKVVEITAGDLYYYQSVWPDAPMAKVR